NSGEDSSPLSYRLKRSTVLIIEGIVQEKDRGHLKSQRKKLSTELLKTVRSQAACDEAAEMLGAEIHINRTPRMKRKGQISKCAETMADRAATFVGALDEGIGLAHGQRFHAVGAKGFTGNAIPRSAAVGTA